MQRTNTVGMTLALVPPGDFLMGSAGADEDAYGDEKPQFHVRITQPFYLGTCPVTVAQFKLFIDDAGYTTTAESDRKGGFGFNAQTGKFEQHTDYGWRNPGFAQGEDHPVVNVTRKDALAFCRWLSREEDASYTLPTEAQWEYACRAGTRTRFWSGDEPESLQGVANVADAALKEISQAVNWTVAWNSGYPWTAPVGKCRANAFGLFDMHGNVWEWCADWYEEDHYWFAERDDPAGPALGTDRVLRGGSWYDRPSYARCASRYGERPTTRLPSCGFRVLREC